MIRIISSKMFAVIFVSLFIVITGSYVYIQLESSDNYSESNPITNCSIEINWDGSSQTSIQINISNTGNTVINLTRYYTIINPQRNYDFTFEVTAPNNVTYHQTCSDWIGDQSYLRYDNYSLNASEKVSFTSSKLALFRGIYPEEMCIEGKYSVQLLFENKFKSNVIEYLEPNPYWITNTTPVWVEPVSTEWHNLNNNETLKLLIAEEMSVEVDSIHIYFYDEIYDNSTCDKYVGAVSEDNSSLVFYFNSTSQKITHIVSSYKAPNATESTAFFLVATGGTNYGNYAGDYLVPSDCTNDGSIYRFLYYDGWFHESFGIVSVNVTAQTLCYVSHVK